MNIRLTHTLLFLSISILAASQIWLSHLRNETSQQTAFLQQEITKKKGVIQALGLEYASLSSPNRLRRLAHRKLGMQAPRSMQVLQP